MTDVHTKAVRSYNMSQVRDKNTKPEEQVRKYLFSRGLRYRLNDKRYPGKPDMVFPKYRTVVFVNGCFWHKHAGCPFFVYPKTNTEFWYEKLEMSRIRDERNKALLEQDGWNVITVWECELRKPLREERLANLYQEIVNY